ncbi:MAG: hypothetical protein ABL958_18760 [Bdellovibrionia bacterium]
MKIRISKLILKFTIALALIAGAAIEAKAMRYVPGDGCMVSDCRGLICVTCRGEWDWGTTMERYHWNWSAWDVFY